MYQVGHGSAEASEEIQASTVYLSTQTASDIYQTLWLSENYTDTQENQVTSRLKQEKILQS